MLNESELENMRERVNSVSDACNSLISAVFEQGYIDLVDLLRKKKYTENQIKMKEANRAYATARKEKGELERIEMDIEHLICWFRQILPRWLDIDPEVVISRAEKEIKDDAETVSAASATIKRTY